MSDQSTAITAQEIEKTERPLWGTWPWTWLTVETALYLGIGFAGLVLRLIRLGGWPLQPEEAASALAAWRILHPAGLSLPAVWSPLLVSSQMALFGIFRATDLAARLLPALAGASLAFLPWLWRRELGRSGAIAAAILLVISPAFLAFSRTADGVLLASALCAWSVSLGYRALREGRPGWMPVSAALLGVALAAAPNTYTWLVCGLLLAAAAQLLGQDPLAVLRPLLTWRTFGALAAAWILGATALLTNPPGLNQAVLLPWRWLSGFSVWRNPVAWHGIVRNLAVYEPLLLALACIGAADLIRQRKQAVWGLLGWSLAAVLLSWLAGNGQPAWIIDALWPLAALAAIGVRSLWAHTFAQIQVFEWAALAPLLALLGFTGLQIVAYARVADGRLLLYAGIGLALTLAAWVGIWLWNGRRSALRVGALLMLILLGIYTTRAATSFIHQTGADAREGYLLASGDLSQRDLEAFLTEHSSHLLGDAHAARIEYPPELDPQLGWELRGFSKTRYLQGAGSLEVDVLIMPYTTSEGPYGFIGQRFTLSREFPRQDLALRDILRWLLLREPVGVLQARDISVWLAVPGMTPQ